MEHVVFFTENPGEPEFRRVGDLEEAVRLVESLRNERGIADVSVHALTPVPVSFRTYYRVEVAPVSSASAEVAEPAVEIVPEPAPEVAVPAVGIATPDAQALGAVSVEAVSPEAEAPALEVPSVEVPAADSLALLPPPVDATPVFELDPTPVFELDEPVDEVVAPAGDVQESSEQLVDEFEALASYEPLVPQVRPEHEVERSLGYFAN